MRCEKSEQFRRSRIQLFSRLKLRNIFAGEWESVYTGEGIEYAAVKPFEPGDDLRDLDLRALAQTGEEEIVQRAAGRELKVFVWADCSGSMLAAEQALLAAKAEIRDIAIALLLYSAWNAYSPTGLCAFAQEVWRFFPARPGERYCDEMLNWLVEREEQARPGRADMAGAIRCMLQRVARQSLVFLVSDFQDAAFGGDFTALLRPAAARFDLVPVVIRDPLEKEGALRRPLRISMCDIEGSGRGEIYLTPDRLRDLQQSSAEHLAHLEQGFRQVGLDHIVLDSPRAESCYQTLAGFFQARRRRR
jgi:uncharacterized protein (DUF58 family)